MGLDLKFNLSAAVVAGMAMRKEAVGTTDEIKSAELDYVEDPCEENKHYLDWLTAEQLLGNIPDYTEFFNVDVIDNDALVRANTGASLYPRLTDFLEANNITWDEF